MNMHERGGGGWPITKMLRQCKM